MVLGLWIDVSLTSGKAAEYQEPLLEDRSSLRPLLLILIGMKGRALGIRFGIVSPSQKRETTVPFQEISNRTHGLRTPKPEYLIALATYLGVRW